VAFIRWWSWMVYLEKKKPKEMQSIRSVLIIAFISWFVFKVLHQAVITSKGTHADALFAGTLFGGVILLICIGIKWFVTRKGQTTKQG